MALADNYVQIYGQLKDVFQSISEGQAPDKFSRQHLKDIGFGSSNFRAVIPLLKTLGFLSDAFGNQPYIWLGLQQQYDLWHASRRKRPKIQAFPRAA